MDRAHRALTYRKSGAICCAIAFHWFDPLGHCWWNVVYIYFVTMIKESGCVIRSRRYLIYMLYLRGWKQSICQYKCGMISRGDMYMVIYTYIMSSWCQMTKWTINATVHTYWLNEYIASISPTHCSTCCSAKFLCPHSCWIWVVHIYGSMPCIQALKPTSISTALVNFFQ